MTGGTVSLSQARQIEALRRLPRPLLWVIAARLKTLSLSIAPVVAGTILAAQAGSWRLDAAVVAALAAIAIQAGTNLWNDAADAARGVDTAERLGPPRVTALGLLDGKAVRQGAAALFIAAAVLGLYLIAIGGAIVVLIGVLSLLFGYLYSMGPKPLSMTPFGEILVVAFFGVAAVAGTAFLHRGQADLRAVELGLIFGLPAAAVLLLNNHRDRTSDSRAGRRTLAIVLGENASRGVYGLFLVGAAGGLGLWLTSICLAAAWAAVPAGLAAFWLTYAIWQTPVSAQLNRLLAKTALFQILLIAAVFASTLLCGA